MLGIKHDIDETKIGIKIMKSCVNYNIVFMFKNLWFHQELFSVA